jgi:hypothetical protein
MRFYFFLIVLLVKNRLTNIKILVNCFQEIGKNNLQEGEDMIKTKVVVREGALRRGLLKTIETITESFASKYPKVCTTIAEPEYTATCSPAVQLSLEKISFSCIHCIFSYTKWKFRLFEKSGRRKVLLVAITEPEFCFDEDGSVRLGNMRCYVRDPEFINVVQENVDLFARKFKIQEVEMVIDYVLEPPTDISVPHRH